MLTLSDNNQADVIATFNSTSRYCGDLILLIILISKYGKSDIQTELQLNKTNSFDSESPILDLSITICIVSSNIHANFMLNGIDSILKWLISPFLDGEVQRSPSNLSTNCYLFNFLIYFCVYSFIYLFLISLN